VVKRQKPNRSGLGIEEDEQPASVVPKSAHSCRCSVSFRIRARLAALCQKPELAILGKRVVVQPTTSKKYVRLSLVYSTQEYLDLDRGYYVKRERLPAIHLDSIRGKYYIRNGHRRALAACLKGRTHILAKTLEPTEPEISFLRAEWVCLKGCLYADSGDSASHRDDSFWR